MLHRSEGASDILLHFMIIWHRCGKLDKLMRYDGADSHGSDP